MKTNSTYIAVVLDRSGSMASVKQATIDGFNEFVDKQKQLPGDCRLMLTQFDDNYDIVFDRPLAEIQPLDDKSYVPRAMTALYDAIGKTVNDVGSNLSKLAEDERPERVVVAVITDGQENASKEFTQKQIADLIKHQQDTYSWNFVFIGANQDAVLTAKTFNIPATSSLSYSGTAASTQSITGSSLSNYVGLVRGGIATQDCAFTDEDRLLASK